MNLLIATGTLQSRIVLQYAKTYKPLGKEKKKNPQRFSVQTHFPERLWESRKQVTETLLSRDPQQQQRSNQQQPLNETSAATSVMTLLHSLTGPWPFSQ